MFLTDTSQLTKFSAPYRVWQGIPGIEVTKKGKMFSCFYTGGVKEGSGNYVVLLKSDDGTSFGDPIAVVYKEGNYRCLDGCLWIDPLGRLWFTWAVMPENATYGVICDDPDAEDIVWGEVFRIGYGVMLNKPIVLCTGEWMFPIAIWKPEAYAWLPKEFISSGKKGSYVYKSTDKGKSFEILGIADDFSSKDCDEHMVIELNDGRLAMYIRTFVGIAVCYSRDRGKTWSKPDKSVLSGPGSRFFIRRLKSGRILLINHANFNGRNNLTALLSEDEGRSWKYQLLLDERDNVSYPDATENEDGYIYITYDRERGSFKTTMSETYDSAREILYSKITEEDIIAGEIVNKGSRLKCTISKLGEYFGEDPFVLQLPYSTEEFISRLMSKCPQDVIGGMFDINPFRNEQVAQWHSKLDDVLSKRTYLR